MPTVEVATTFRVTPDTKTIRGYREALRALEQAGAPLTTLMSVEGGAIVVTITDQTVIEAIKRSAQG